MPDQSVSLDDEDLAAQSAVKHLRKLKIDNDTVRRLLGEARTHNVWPVSYTHLRAHET